MTGLSHFESWDLNEQTVPNTDANQTHVFQFAGHSRIYQVEFQDFQVKFWDFQVEKTKDFSRD